MKIKAATETVVTLSANEFAIMEYVMIDKGELLFEIIKPIFRYLIQNINDLDNDEIKIELPSILLLMDLLQANFQPKQTRQLTNAA
jgi:hypothetical protein